MSLNEDQHQVAETVQKALVESMSSLTAAHGCEVGHFGPDKPNANQDQAQWVYTRVDFSGAGLKGCLVLAATQTDAHGLWPLHNQGPSPTGEDMVAEFANCLLGSIQTRLCSEHIEIFMSTPQTIRGLGTTVLPTSSNTEWERFRIRTANVYTQVEVNITPDFRWQPLAHDGDPPLGEGGCIVF